MNKIIVFADVIVHCRAGKQVIILTYFHIGITIAAPTVEDHEL